MDGDSKKEERGGLFKFLDVASAKLDSLRAPSPSKHLSEPSPETSSSPGRQSSRSRSTSRTVEVLEPAAPLAPVDHSDEHEKDDVIRLLKQCISAAQQEEEQLKLQIAQLQKDVDYWKAESYKGISKTFTDIANSPQYVDLKEKLKQEKARSSGLEAQLTESNQVVSAARAQAEAAVLEADKAKRDLANVQAEILAMRKTFEQQARDAEAIAKLSVEQGEKERLGLLEQLKKAEQVRDDEIRLRQERERELAERTEALRVACAEADAATVMLGARQQQHHENHGAEEFHCLLRDREMLAAQLYEAQRQLKALEVPGRKPAAVSAAPAAVAEPVETLPLIVPPATDADIALQKRFALPESERQIAVHGATFLGQHGFVYLADEHICFGGSAVKSFYEKKDLVLPLKQVSAIDKTGSKSHVKLLLKDGTVHELSGLKHRKVFAVQVRSASARLGTAIDILRDGKMDLDSGVLPDLQEDDFLLV